MTKTVQGKSIPELELQLFVKTFNVRTVRYHGRWVATCAFKNQHGTPHQLSSAGDTVTEAVGYLYGRVMDATHVHERCDPFVPDDDQWSF